MGEPADWDDLMVPDEDLDDEDDYDAGEECGRWDNGRLGKQCALAGTEFCDWESPYGF